jgi:glucose/arabinose dehydrogenase
MTTTRRASLRGAAALAATTWIPPGRALSVLFLLCAAIAAPADAQRRGLPAQPLANGPFEYVTGEPQKIRVNVLSRGLEKPWSLAFLPDGSMLITERPGRVRLFRDGMLEPEPIGGVPAVRFSLLGGLSDIKLHPDFEHNHYVYLTYDKPMGDKGEVFTVARAVFDGRTLKDLKEILTVTGGTSMSRMLFAPDGKLHVSVFGEPGEIAQNPMELSGKTLRLNDDGTVPEDNPFVGRAGHRPEIYTLGHRSPEGMVWHDGKIWETEMGPNGGDEVNVLTPGGNYGWPYVSMGRSYPGPYQRNKFHLDGMIESVVFWVPSISTTGMTFYTGDKLPAWKGNLFVGGVRYGEIAGTGSLSRIVFNENMEEIRREALLTDLHQRIRDVRQGPDELLYVLTDETDGALLRIEPAE